MPTERPQRSDGRRLALICAAIIAACVSITTRGFSLGSDQALGRKTSLAVQEAQVFASRCGGCHGMDGRGGEHAPDITSGSAAQLSDADLERVVRDGIPVKGMPAFVALGPAGIKGMVAYLRILQGGSGVAAVKGNADRGKGLFYGLARCSECHMVHGAGGFLGPDLSNYSQSHSPERIRQAIVNPNLDLSPNRETVTAVTRDGTKLVGLARNEDNFSLQLQTVDGSFHLLMKSDLETLSHESRSLMPSDYTSRLSARDLDDLVSYLVSISAASLGKGARSQSTER